MSLRNGLEIIRILFEVTDNFGVFHCADFREDAAGRIQFRSERFQRLRVTQRGK